MLEKKTENKNRKRKITNMIERGDLKEDAGKV